jgi:hypothetical protein
MAFLSVLGGAVGNNCITLFIPNNAVAFIHFGGGFCNDYIILLISNSDYPFIHLVGRDFQWFYYFSEAFVMIILHYLYVIMVVLLSIFGGRGFVMIVLILFVSNAGVHTHFEGRSI